jgi:hypothetical protein
MLEFSVGIKKKVCSVGRFSNWWRIEDVESDNSLKTIKILMPILIFTGQQK